LERGGPAGGTRAGIEPETGNGKVEMETEGGKLKTREYGI